MAEIEATVAYIVDKGFIAKYNDPVSNLIRCVQLYPIHSFDVADPIQAGDSVCLKISGRQIIVSRDGLPMYRGEISAQVQTYSVMQADQDKLRKAITSSEQRKQSQELSRDLYIDDTVLPPFTD